MLGLAGNSSRLSYAKRPNLDRAIIQDVGDTPNGARQTERLGRANLP